MREDLLGQRVTGRAHGRTRCPSRNPRRHGLPKESPRSFRLNPALPNGFNAEAREDLRQEIDRLRSEVRDLREKSRGEGTGKESSQDQPKSF